MRLSYCHTVYDEVLNATLAQVDCELSVSIVWDANIPSVEVDGIWITNDAGQSVYLWGGTQDTQRLAASIKTAAEEDEDLLGRALMSDGLHARPAVRLVYSTNGART